MKKMLGICLLVVPFLCVPATYGDTRIAGEPPPGTIVIRHGKRISMPPVGFLLTRGFVEDIPHAGLYLGKGEVYDLRIVNREGVVFRTIPDDANSEKTFAARFKNAGWFSVVESNGYVWYKDELTRFKDLPSAIKEQILESVCEKAQKAPGPIEPAENGGRTATAGESKGTYELRTNNCLHPILGYYDEALQELGVTPVVVRRDEERRLFPGESRHMFPEKPIPGTNLNTASRQVILKKTSLTRLLTVLGFLDPSLTDDYFKRLPVFYLNWGNAKPEPNPVRSTKTTNARGEPITGVEAGPVSARLLGPALLGQMQWRRGSALAMRDLLPTSGPPGTVRVGPLSVDHVLEMSQHAVEAAAQEFRGNPQRHDTTQAVALVMNTVNRPYEHDYPICPRFHLSALDNLDAVPLSLTDSDANEAWFWFSSFHDSSSGGIEVGCHFAVFVSEANRNLTVDSRWFDKQYCPYWRSRNAKPYDYILNFQLWSYNGEETMKLLDSVLRRLEQLSGWDVRYANQHEPTQPTVFVEEAWLSGNTVYLSVWNRSWLPTMACFHGTKQSVPGGQHQAFEAWRPVHPGRNQLQLPLGSIDNAVIHCEAHGFMDKVFVSRGNTRPAARPDAAPETDWHISTEPAKRPSVHITWPPPDAIVVTLQDQLDMPRDDDGKRVAVHGICLGAPEGSRVAVQVYTDTWHPHQGRQPEMKDGVWGVRAYLSGEGEHNKHWIHAALYDRRGNKLAEDRVGPIYRVTPLPDDAAARVERQGAGERAAERLADQPQQFAPLTVEAAKFRVSGTARFPDGSIVIGGGPDGPHGRGGTAVYRVDQPQDASRIALEISLWHGTPGQLGRSRAMRCASPTPTRRISPQRGTASAGAMGCRLEPASAAGFHSSATRSRIGSRIPVMGS